MFTVVQSLGSRVSVRAWGLGFKVRGYRRYQGLGFRKEGSVPGSGILVWGLRCYGERFCSDLKKQPHARCLQ